MSIYTTSEVQNFISEVHKFAEYYFNNLMSKNEVEEYFKDYINSLEEDSRAQALDFLKDTLT